MFAKLVKKTGRCRGCQRCLYKVLPWGCKLRNWEITYFQNRKNKSHLNPWSLQNLREQSGRTIINQHKINVQVCRLVQGVFLCFRYSWDRLRIYQNPDQDKVLSKDLWCLYIYIKVPVQAALLLYGSDTHTHTFTHKDTFTHSHIHHSYVIC